MELKRIGWPRVLECLPMVFVLLSLSCILVPLSSLWAKLLLGSAATWVSVAIWGYRGLFPGVLAFLFLGGYTLELPVLLFVGIALMSGAMQAAWQEELLEKRDRIEKKLFYVETEKLALEREKFLQSYLEDPMQKQLIALLSQTEQKRMALQEEVRQLEALVSALQSPKKRTAYKKTKPLDVQLDFVDMLLEKNASSASESHNHLE